MYRIKVQFYGKREDNEPEWEVIVNKIDFPLQMLDKYEFTVNADSKNRISFLREVSEEFLANELMSYNGDDNIAEMQEYNQVLISTMIENGKCEKMMLCIYDTSSAPKHIS